MTELFSIADYTQSLLRKSNDLELSEKRRTPDDILSSLSYSKDNPLMCKYRADHYSEGKIIKKDTQKAIDLMKEALKLDYTFIEDLIKLLWEENKPETNQELFALVQSLTIEQDPSGYGWMARCYLDGRGVKTNLN